MKLETIIGIIVVFILFAGNSVSKDMFGAQTVCFPYQGCTGTSTNPAAGNLLIGNSAGTGYDFIASSSLTSIGNVRVIAANTLADYFPYFITAGSSTISASSTIFRSGLNLFTGGAFNASGTITQNGTAVLTTSSISFMGTQTSTINQGFGLTFSSTGTLGFTITDYVQSSTISGVGNILWGSATGSISINPSSTFTGIVSANTLNVTSTFTARASSTFPTYATCTALETNANGLLICGDDASGGGGASSTWTYVLTPGDAVMPNTNFPAFNKRVDTIYSIETLDYDGATQESAYWAFGLPSNLGTGAASTTITIFWTVSSTAPTTASTTQWLVHYSSLNDDSALNTAGATSTLSDTFIVSADIHVVATALTSSTFAQNELAQFKISRDVANDDIAQDAKFWKAVLTLIW